MCGLTGFWTLRSGPDCETILHTATEALAHRGPDAQGLWGDATAGIYLGHRRLSILDLSAEGAQPMMSPSGRYMIVFNGEFYNFNELKAALATTNPVYRGHSDTEVFLHAVDRFGGKAAIELSQGMFAFALWDAQENILTLARDRFGKKPLYIGWAGQDLFFSSELKPFHKHPAFQKRVNKGAFDLYMTYGYVPAPQTIFEGVWQMLPGHMAEFHWEDVQSGGDLSKKFKPFWSAVETATELFHRKTFTAEADLPAEMDTVLQAAVAKRMVADVPLGAFLSGGIDSSLVTALMQAQSSNQIKTYSIGFAEDTFDEAPFAKKIADHLKTDHHEFYVQPVDALNAIVDLPTVYDEPFADISAIPTCLLTKLARQEVTVALSGDGGDEMMGGYTRHISAPLIFQTLSYIPSALRHGGARYLSALPPRLQNKIEKLRPFLEEDDMAQVFSRLLSLSSSQVPWTQNATVMAYPLQEYIHRDVGELSVAEMMILGDTLHTLPNKFLVKVDRASMAHSLEVRSPFLDTAVFEYAWTLPLQVKIRHGKGKWLLREVLKKYVPESLFDRPKQGFNIPLAQWLNRDLRGWADDLLGEEELSENGFRSDLVRRAWAGHLSGSTIFTNQLWAVLQYQCWARRWL